MFPIRIQLKLLKFPNYKMNKFKINLSMKINILKKAIVF